MGVVGAVESLKVHGKQQQTSKKFAFAFAAADAGRGEVQPSLKRPYDHPQQEGYTQIWL
jgi:hypothetical protein